MEIRAERVLPLIDEVKRNHGRTACPDFISGEPQPQGEIVILPAQENHRTRVLGQGRGEFT
ncbi:MAG: hypothetical protein H0U67_09550 [Gemmatimonadetes bacterium]|nr:hypothetical protein [Gemmatimonadota bacterium]MBA4158216.1 hypothetical protein [Gemmatimonadota bacterium]